MFFKGSGSFFSVFINLLICTFIHSCKLNHENEYKTWSNYLGDKSVSHYSSLHQIDTSNVQLLKVAWLYSTGDADILKNSQIQCNPIIVKNILYGTSPRLKLFALDASTGKPKWVFDPFSDTLKTKMQRHVNRGVNYWSDGKNERIFYTAGSFLYAIDAKTGKGILSFGNRGTIDLHDGLDRDVQNLNVKSTSPGIIYKNLLIKGITVSESGNVAPGHVRAYDVRTGELKWIFHTIPHPGEFGYDTWENKDAWKYIGGANNWSGMSLDEKRGVVYISTGSPTDDFYGGFRKGKGLFSNCVLALDAATGKYVWHYQTIHHDLWDRDLPAPPNLVTINRNGKKVDAVAQVSKTGFIFILNRDNGQPLFSVEEVKVPDSSTLIGEKPWPTQPIPQLPKAFTRQTFTEADINPFVSESSQIIVQKKLAQIESGNMFIPPSERGALIFPGFDGGAEWGGAAYDPVTGVLYINANQVPWTLTMVKKMNEENRTLHETISERGQKVYINNCMACHGKNREGNASYPSLQHINRNYSTEQLLDIVNNGRGRMPSFKQIDSNEEKALVTFLLELNEGKMLFKETENKARISKAEKSPFVPYTMTGYNKFRTPEGYPANNPPWGTLTAINLSTGETVWEIPLGEYPELKKKGVPVTGTENYGGAVVTSGGLLFIAATLDGKFRAFNKRTGQLLWETDLPVAGFATPSTYEVNGKQYVVIACGGGKLGVPSGDIYMAFALP